MIKVAILYHSGYGHTKKVAENVFAGVESAGDVDVRMVFAPEWQESVEFLNEADAIIFGAPTYMGSASAPFKQFMDEESKIWFGLGWKDKIAAGFTNSGALSGDKSQTLTQFVTFAMQNGMIWVGNPQMPTGITPESINRIGSFTGLMTQADNAPADITPPSGDLETARNFGVRVATVTKQFVAGRG